MRISDWSSDVCSSDLRAIAASNIAGDRLSAALDISEANGIARYGALQPWFNLVDRAQFDADVRQLCISRDVGIVTYFSLASGFLTGKYRRPADEVGRATCRERVCPYVYISVGRVSF